MRIDPGAHETGREGRRALLFAGVLPLELQSAITVIGQRSRQPLFHKSMYMYCKQMPKHQDSACITRARKHKDAGILPNICRYTCKLNTARMHARGDTFLHLHIHLKKPEVRLQRPPRNRVWKRSRSDGSVALAINFPCGGRWSTTPWRGLRSLEQGDGGRRVSSGHLLGCY